MSLCSSHSKHSSITLLSPTVQRGEHKRRSSALLYILHSSTHLSIPSNSSEPLSTTFLLLSSALIMRLLKLFSLLLLLLASLELCSGATVDTAPGSHAVGSGGGGAGGGGKRPPGGRGDQKAQLFHYNERMNAMGLLWQYSKFSCSKKSSMLTGIVATLLDKRISDATALRRIQGALQEIMRNGGTFSGYLRLASGTSEAFQITHAPPARKNGAGRTATIFEYLFWSREASAVKNLAAAQSFLWKRMVSGKGIPHDSYLPSLLFMGAKGLHRYSRRAEDGSADQACSECIKNPGMWDSCGQLFNDEEQLLFDGACVPCWSKGKEKLCSMYRGKSKAV